MGSAPFHKASIIPSNPKTKQTIICRSFHQLESSDVTILSFPLSISTINNEDISTSTPDQVPPVLSSPTTHLLRQTSLTPQRPIPYLLRSRYNPPPPQVHLVTPPDTSNAYSNHQFPRSSPRIIQSIISLTSPLYQPSNCVSSLLTQFSFELNMLTSIPRTFQYGHCP